MPETFGLLGELAGARSPFFRCASCSFRIIHYDIALFLRGLHITALLSHIYLLISALPCLLPYLSFSTLSVQLLNFAFRYEQIYDISLIDIYLSFPSARLTHRSKTREPKLPHTCESMRAFS